MSTWWSLAAGVLLGNLSALMLVLFDRRRRVRRSAEVEAYAQRLLDDDLAASPPPPPRPGQALNVRALETLARRLGEARATEQGKADRARRVAEAVIEAMPDPVLVLDAEAKVTRFNGRARQVLGDVLTRGRAASELTPQVLALAAEEAAAGFPVASNAVPRLQLVEAGATRQYRVRALPLRLRGAGGAAGGEPGGAVIVLHDVTELDAEASEAAAAAQSALSEIRPLVDALGVQLLATQGPGVETWSAIARLLADLDALERQAPAEAIDLAALVENAVEAVALEAQRRRVKVTLWVARPAPRPSVSAVAVERLLLRTLRQVVQRTPPGQTAAVEVQRAPSARVRFMPGLDASALAPLDVALLQRAQATRVGEAGGATVIAFA